MRNTFIVAGRELGGYFATPVAVVFIVIFLALQGVLTFNLGNFFERNQADLQPFFTFIPWVFLLLVPAITMRLWAEERRLGTIELLLTLPITQAQAVVGKFLAAWVFCIIALALTFPFVITVNILGKPDNGVIATGYLGAVLVAGSFLSVGAALSAATKNQVIAFVLAVAVCFVFAVASYPVVTDFLSQNLPVLADVARHISVADRFQSFTRGVISVRDLIFFASFIGFWLFLNTVIVDHRKADRPMDISPSPSPARRGGFRLWSSIIGVIAVAAILVGINMVADTQAANAQLDLTQQHLFTLSPGTRTILAGLKEPVTLRLYYSRALGARIPVYGAYADRVREMLEQYARLSDGKVRLEFYNPEPFSDTEDRAVAYGLQGVPVDNSGEQVYFGLVGTNLLDDERTVPFFQPERERFLEYDLSRLIYELSNPKRPVIGVMSSLPLDGDPRMMMMNRGQGGAGGPWASMMLLRQSFDVKNVATDAISIDPDVRCCWWRRRSI